MPLVHECSAQALHVARLARVNAFTARQAPPPSATRHEATIATSSTVAAHLEDRGDHSSEGRRFYTALTLIVQGPTMIGLFTPLRRKLTCGS